MDANSERHGRWVLKTEFGRDYYVCSECGKEALGKVDMNDNFTQILTPGCPYCLAKLDQPESPKRKKVMQ